MLEEEGRIINMSQNLLITKNLWLYLQYECSLCIEMHYNSISESDQLNSTINTGYTLIDQARTLMVKQAPGLHLNKF